jgi:nucleoside 2-deoxyribosyltransferase
MSASETEPIDIDEDVSEKLKQAHNRNPLVYLAGPIEFADDDGKTWRNETIELFSDVDYVNPHDIFSREEIQKVYKPTLEGEIPEGNYDEFILDEEVTTQEKQEILRCDAVFVGFQDIKSRGTCMEMMFCYLNRIPIYIWNMDKLDDIPLWVTSHAQYISDSREKVIEKIKGDF